MKDDDIDRITAVHSLGFHNFHGAGFESSPFIFPDGETPPTEEAIQAELARLQIEYDAQKYARNRKNEYDALNQFELISDDTKNGTTTHIDAIDAIKAKYPKPE